MKSRLRTLHLDDGREFTWRADVLRLPATGRAIRVRVWGAGKTGCALQADLRPIPSATDAYPFPGAADVRALIAYGLGAGWDPQSRGGTFPVPPTAEIALSTLTLAG